MKRRGIIVIRKKIFIVVTIAIILCVLGGGNYETHDQEAFYSAYINPVNSFGFESGYFALQSLLHKIGLPYRWYKLLVSIASVFSLLFISEHFNANTTWVLLLYFCFPFVHDTYNLRNTVATVIIWISFCFLANRRRRDIIISLILILIATLFHRSSVVYLVPLLVIFLLRNTHLLKPLIKASLGIVAIFALLCAFFPKILTAITSAVIQLIPKMQFGNKLVYFELKGRYGFLLYYAIQLTCIILLYLCHRQYYFWKKTRCIDITTREIIGKNESLVQVALITSISLLLLVAMYKLNNTFFRIFRNIMPLICVAVSACLNETKGTNHNREFIIKIFTTLLFTFLFLWDITGYDRDIIWKTMFQGNWILGT